MKSYRGLGDVRPGRHPVTKGTGDAPCLDLSIPKELSNQFYCNTAISNDVSNRHGVSYNAVGLQIIIIPFPV